MGLYKRSAYMADIGNVWLALDSAYRRPFACSSRGLKELSVALIRMIELWPKESWELSFCAAIWNHLFSNSLTWLWISKVAPTLLWIQLASFSLGVSLLSLAHSRLEALGSRESKAFCWPDQTGSSLIIGFNWASNWQPAQRQRLNILQC